MGKEIEIQINSPHADEVDVSTIDFLGKFILRAEVERIVLKLQQEGWIPPNTYPSIIKVRNSQHPDSPTSVEVGEKEMYISTPLDQFRN